MKMSTRPQHYFGETAIVTDELDARRRLSFAQAEGVAPLPAQLQLGEVSQQLRAALWHVVHDSLMQSLERPEFAKPYIGRPWGAILKDEYIYRRHKMADDFTTNANVRTEDIRGIIENGNYVAVFDWIEFVLKHPSCPQGFSDKIDSSLRFCSAAYRVIETKMICPIASETEHKTIVRAFADLASTQFNGARAHLTKAASQLSARKYADSVRESIHAVEATARTLDPSAELSKALARLEQTISMHGAMKKGFLALYGYTSDENGIRHALLDDGEANVDEADALFMLGACAAFVSYLLSKARTSGIISA